jgi:hypothetical protein
LLDIFGVPRIVWRIKPFEPLPGLRQEFDWITAFSIGFDRYRPEGGRWEKAEWDFFLHDLQRQLAPGGKIYLTLNPLPNGDYHTPELRKFLISRGADIERERISFPAGVAG